MNMSVDEALREREAAGRPIRVGMVGAGATGRAIALQLGTPVPGIRLVAIANRMPEHGERALREAGATAWGRAGSVREAEAAIKRGLPALTDDPSVLTACDAIDLLAIAETYTTNFPLTENPISEGGHWINGSTTGIDWSDVQTIPGQAFSTETRRDTNFADPTALLTGSWGPTQTVQAVVRILAADSADLEEVELRLRSSLSAHSCTGYEVNFSVKPDNIYCAIVRWNGPLGDFTRLGARRVGVVNGDVVKATAVGSTITCYINNTAIFSVNDTTYPSGNPGRPRSGS